MLPEFKVHKYNMRKAREDFYKENEIFKNVFSQFTNSQLIEDILENDNVEFKEWFVQNKEKYKYDTPKFKKIKYDYSKPAKDQNIQARNNALIDLMWGVLTNPDTASKILTPGNFDYQKKAARISAILSNVSENELRQILIDSGIELNKTIKKNNREYPVSVVSYLLAINDLNILDRIYAKIKTKIDPLNPSTQVYLHQQNMTGAKLIGIYANHNANHALLQHTKVEVNDNGSFIFNGKKLTKLNAVKNDLNEFISTNNAGFLAASVDNVKDPVLALLNQNVFTANISMLLSRLGYTPVEIGILLNQPIIKEITTRYFRENREGATAQNIIESTIEKYKKAAAITADISYDTYKSEKFLIEDLAENIFIEKEIANIEDLRHFSDMRYIEYNSKQVAVGILFNRMYNTAEALNFVVAATRADTQNGAAGPSIADTVLKIQKVTDLANQIYTNNKFPLNNAMVIQQDLSNHSLNALRESLLNSELPYIQAFYTLGVECTRELFSKYFPHYTYSFTKVIDSIRNMTKVEKLDAKTMNSIYNDLLAYVMTNTEFFNSKHRNTFINEFPSRFKEIINNNPDIAGLEFIKRLRVIPANRHNPVDTLVFKNVGQLSAILRDRFMNDWEYLLYMNNPEAHKLALDLFRYSSYRNGFAFGPSTFIHLAPTAIRKAIPEYIDTLRIILDNEIKVDNFIDQYIYNHLDNRKLVPEISKDSSIKFIDDDKNAINTVYVSISKDSSNVDKKIIRKTHYMESQQIYEFHPYISYRYKGGFIYYRLMETTEDTAIYERIAPLGYFNSFIEYDYNSTVNEIKSVIIKNDLEYDPNATTISRFTLNDSQKFHEAPADLIEIKDSSMDSLIREAFSRFGYNYTETTEDTGNFDNMPQNENWADDNANIICSY